MISSQEFESISWSVEEDLLVEELVLRADNLLTSRNNSSATDAAPSTGASDSQQQAVLPQNALETTADPSQPSEVEAVHQAFRLPDLEDIGLVLDRRRYRPAGLQVSDFTAAEWCQQQFALALTAALPRELTKTEAMEAGTDLHRALELEVKTVVEVEVTSREDAWGLRLIESICGLRTLMRKGMTREVYVFGKLQGHWVKGIVDELQLDELGKVRVVEQKSRRNSSVPTHAQKDTARLQVMMYRSLLLGLADACDGDSASDILALHQLDGEAELSKEVLRFARQQKVATVVNLRDLLGSLRAAALKLPPCSEEMRVRYLWQEDRSLLGCMDVWWDAEWMQRQVSAHLAMLAGEAAPAKVPPEHDWKCGYCMFFHACGGPSLCANAGPPGHPHETGTAGPPSAAAVS